MDISSDDSDLSFCNGSPLRTRSSSSSSSDTSSVSSAKSKSTSSEEEKRFLDSNYDIITEVNLKQFVHRVDKFAVLDDQAADMLAKIADVFVNDVARRVAKLAEYRKERADMLDLKFVLKREYNMEFPQENAEEQTIKLEKEIKMEQENKPVKEISMEKDVKVEKK